MQGTAQTQTPTGLLRRRHLTWKLTIDQRKKNTVPCEVFFLVSTVGVDAEVAEVYS
jgi:hypothetical protein